MSLCRLPGSERLAANRGVRSVKSFLLFFFVRRQETQTRESEEGGGVGGERKAEGGFPWKQGR